MMIFEGMLVPAATDVGMAVPMVYEVGKYNPDEFPHWHVYCMSQLGAPVPRWGVHFDNAKIIKSIPDHMIRKVTFDDLEALGCEYGPRID